MENEQFWNFLFSELYKIANNPNKYESKQSFSKDSANQIKRPIKGVVKKPKFGSDWEPEDVERVISEELREIQETLMVPNFQSESCLDLLINAAL